MLRIFNINGQLLRYASLPCKRFADENTCGDEAYMTWGCWGNSPYTEEGYMEMLKAVYG